MSSARRNDAVLGVVALVVILLDQLTKHWIVGYFASGTPRQPIQILGPFVDLEYVQNAGVAFSLMTGKWYLFVFIAVALVVVGALYWRTRRTGAALLIVSFGMILGGAVGNLIDRVSHEYVVDFIHFQIPGAAGHPPVFDFAVFNVADSAISIGVVLLALLLWRGSVGSALDRPAPDGEPTSSSSATVDDASSLATRRRP